MQVGLLHPTACRWACTTPPACWMRVEQATHLLQYELPWCVSICTFVLGKQVNYMSCSVKFAPSASVFVLLY
jgi:hypothetical protein